MADIWAELLASIASSLSFSHALERRVLRGHVEQAVPEALLTAAMVKQLP